MDDLQRRLAALRAKPTQAASPPPAKVESPPSGLARRLSGLEAPTEADEAAVPISTKNVDDEMAAFLLSASSAPPSLPSPPTTKLNDALESYESLLPSLSPIEVYYAAPPPTSERSSSEEAQLMARLRDELSLDRAHGTEDEQRVDGWSRRMEGLKGVVSGGTKREEVARGLGAPPEAVELGDLKGEARGSEEEEESSESEKTSESEPDSEEE